LSINYPTLNIIYGRSMKFKKCIVEGLFFKTPVAILSHKFVLNMFSVSEYVLVYFYYYCLGQHQYYSYG